MWNPDGELAAQRSELRQHWPTLLGSTLAASVGTIGLQAYTNGSFVPAIVADTGYSREQISLATLLLSATVAITAPFAGQLIDQVGARRVIALSIVGEAAAFLVLSATPVGFGWFAGAMMLLGFLGVGSTPPSFSRLISARFDRRRGLALGIMISGLGITAISAPLWATAVIGLGGWRTGYRVLAGLVLVMGVLGLIVMQFDRAEPMPREAMERGGWSALRRPLFWIIMVSFAAPALFGGGYLFHMITLLRERGFSAGDAAKVQAAIGASIIGGRLLSGAAMDRLFAPYVAAIAFGLAALGCLLLQSTSTPILYLGALAVGLPIGAELDILAYTVSRYFGIASFGRYYSLAYSLMIFAGGLSPVMIAFLSPGGDYSLALAVSTVGIAASAIAVALLPRFTAAHGSVHDGALAAKH